MNGFPLLAAVLSALALAGCDAPPWIEPADDPETAEEVESMPSRAPPLAEPQNLGETSPDLSPDEDGAASPGQDRLTAPLLSADGQEIGAVTVTSRDQGVALHLQARGLEPGVHAVHFHEHGRCEPPDFQSAGGHYDPTGAEHGRPGPDREGHHAGDMRNQQVDDDGRLDTRMVNHAVSIAGTNPLQDDDGTALIIHGGTDDYQSQPAGDAGSRVACAVVAPPQ